MNRFVAFLNTLLRRCLWLGALGLVLAALYVSLGRQLVPLVAEYRLEAQDKARELLDMPVTLGRLEGSWEGFAPRLVVHDALLGSGDAAVRLDSLSIVPDLPASLWARKLRLAAVELNGVQLNLIQTEDGQWRVEGLPRRERTDASPPDLEKLFAELARVRRLALFDSQLTVEAAGESPFTLSYANLDISIDGRDLRLDGRLVLPDGQPLAMRLQARVQPQQWRESQAELYLNLPQSDWAAWLPRRLTGEWHLQHARAGGEIWASWRDQGLARAVTRIHARSVQGAFAERPSVRLENLALNLYAERSEAGYRLQADGLAFSLDESRWPETRVLLTRDRAAGRWSLSSDRVSVAPLASLVRALAPLPEVAAPILEGLAPTGNLRNLQLDYHPDAPLAERLAYAANLEAAGISAHNWIPAVRNVSGSVKGNLGGGELRFDNHEFSLHLAELFPEPWAYRQARGSLRWTLDDEAFSLVAPYLSLEGEEGQLGGDFMIRLMRDPAAENYMDLRVGLSGGDARYTEKYLPTRSAALSPALSDWLVTAIRGGIVDQGYFQYQGALGKADPEARSLSLYFKVRDAELAFQPGWPVLREGRGEVMIENSGVLVRLAEGRMLDSRVSDAVARVSRTEERNPPRLTIRGTVDGSLKDGLTLLQVAPLGTAELFAGWKASGPLQGALDLDIPLGSGDPPRAVVDFASRDASLWIPQANLGLEQLSGRFRYDTERGLSASDIQARALGQAVRGKASAVGKSGRAASRIEAYGSTTVPALLGWLGMERPVPVSGELPYQLRLDIDGPASQLQLDSSLLGAAIDLPKPFAKPAAQRRDTSVRISLGDGPRRYTVQHGDLAALAFQVPDGDWLKGGGELVLGGGAANLRAGEGLYVRGRLSEFDLSAWQAALDGHGDGGSESGVAEALLRRAELDVAQFSGFGQNISGLGVVLRRGADFWSLGLKSGMLAGTLLRPDATGVPGRLNLDHLRLPASEAGTAGDRREDPLAAVDPSGFPPIDVDIRELWWGDDLLGPWSLKMRPASGGVAFSDLDLLLKGLRVTGSGGWQKSRSWYKGRMQGENLADVLVAWGFAPTVSSEGFRLDADAHWPGSPAFLGLERLSGDLSARMSDGQLREVEGSAQALRVFGLLNFNSIGRRLRLDFSDLFGKGLSYDRFRGELKATDGVYLTKEPMTITGPSSNLELDGRLDMVRDQIDAKLLVTLPVSNNLPLAALIAGAPAIGGALFVVDKLLGDRVARFASVQYKVQGPWRAPEIIFDKPFEKPN